MESDLFTEFLARDIDRVALDVVAVVSHIPDGREKYFKKKAGDLKSASGVEIELNRYSKLENTRKVLKFPNLNSYLRVVVYYHPRLLGLEVTKEDPKNKNSKKKTLLVLKPKRKRKSS